MLEIGEEFLVGNCWIWWSYEGWEVGGLCLEWWMEIDMKVWR